MDEILETLSNTAGVDATLLIGKDGLVISTAGRTDGVEMDLMGATAAEILNSAETMLGGNAADTIIFEAKAGKYFLNAVNDEVFLLVLARKKINLGLVRWETRESAGKLKDVL
jgi:predicted regulator of Ras-like GTPase activity (Roadblock/LC7/MglB family)